MKLKVFICVACSLLFAQPSFAQPSQSPYVGKWQSYVVVDRLGGLAVLSGDALPTIQGYEFISMQIDSQLNVILVRNTCDSSFKNKATKEARFRATLSGDHLLCVSEKPTDNLETLDQPFAVWLSNGNLAAQSDANTYLQLGAWNSQLAHLKLITDGNWTAFRPVTEIKWVKQDVVGALAIDKAQQVSQ